MCAFINNSWPSLISCASSTFFSSTLLLLLLSVCAFWFVLFFLYSSRVLSFIDIANVKFYAFTASWIFLNENNEKKQTGCSETESSKKIKTTSPTETELRIRYEREKKNLAKQQQIIRLLVNKTRVLVHFQYRRAI